MRESFPGYYRPTEEEFVELWEQALIVPDTNVLLTLYRLPVATRSQLLEILNKLKERLFISYQVGAEFQRNRLDVIEEQMRTYAEVEKAIDVFATNVGKEVREHPRIDRADLEGRIAKGLKPIKKHLEGLRQGHPDPLTDSDPLGPDAVRDELDNLLEGRIGEPRNLEKLAEEGGERYEGKVPPGWGDAKKPEPDRYGDLAIWLDVIAKAKAEGKPVILVTEDRKPDWWSIRDGKTIGPRPELIEEMREKAEQRLWMYGLPRFMEEAAKVLGIELNEDARGDIRRAETAAKRDHFVALQERQPLIDKETSFFSTTPSGPFESPVLAYSGHNPAFTRVNPPNASFWPSEFQPRWISRVAVEENSALLGIGYETQYSKLTLYQPANRLVCSVRDPTGETALASRRDKTLSAAFRYPDNFSGVDSADPGSYRYVWYFASAEDTELTEISAGEFEIPVAEAG